MLGYFEKKQAFLSFYFLRKLILVLDDYSICTSDTSKMPVYASWSPYRISCPECAISRSSVGILLRKPSMYPVH